MLSLSASADNPVEIAKAMYTQYINMMMNDVESDVATTALSDELSNIISEACEKGEQNDDVVIDCDYWLCAQDADELSLVDAKLVSSKGKTAVVDVTIKNCGSTTLIRLNMVETPDGEWKIDDFIDVENDIDLKKNLTEYLNAGQ